MWCKIEILNMNLLNFTYLWVSKMCNDMCQIKSYRAIYLLPMYIWPENI